MSGWIRGAISAAVLAALAAACGPARTGEPILGPQRFTGEAERGQRLFMNYCYQCHPGGEPAIGVGLSNDYLYPDFAVRLQVRNGFGAMPEFSEKVINDRELDAIIAYLHELRAWRGRAPL